MATLATAPAGHAEPSESPRATSRLSPNKAGACSTGAPTAMCVQSSTPWLHCGTPPAAGDGAAADRAVIALSTTDPERTRVRHVALVEQIGAVLAEALASSPAQRLPRLVLFVGCLAAGIDLAGISVRALSHGVRYGFESADACFAAWIQGVQLVVIDV